MVRDSFKCTNHRRHEVTSCYAALLYLNNINKGNDEVFSIGVKNYGKITV